MIELKNLTKVYETINYNIIAISSANFKLELGEVVVLLGKSGSGKSTLLNILGGFDKDFAGDYFFENQDMKQLKPEEIDKIRREKIGFVFQNYALLENLSVVENVELALDVVGIVNKQRKRRAALDALGLVGLREHAEKKPSQLSGGQKQRVAIARAFVKNPDVIIADEPTAALDARTSVEVLDILSSLCRNKLLIIATHNKSIVRDYGTRVLELKSGYTIKDELVLPDKSNVEVDDIDKVIDKEIGFQVKKVETKIQKKKVLEESDSKILQDLGINTDELQLRKQEGFEIDDELKKQIIEHRKQNEQGATRVKRFAQVSNEMVGKNEYARRSFFRYFPIHAFSSFLIVLFMLSLIIGLNFVNEVFRGFNEKADFFQDYKTNSVFIEFDEEYSYNLYETTEKYEENFVIGYNNIDPELSRFYEAIEEDNSYKYRKKYNLFNELSAYLDSEGYEDEYSIYYDNNNILRSSKYDDTFLDTLYNIEYEQINSEAFSGARVTKFMDTNLDDADYSFNYIYTEGNEDVLKYHIIEGGKLPSAADEIVIPISALSKYYPDLISQASNSNFIDSKEIQTLFEALPENEKIIEIQNRNIDIVDADPDTLNYNFNTSTQFKVVGLLNISGDISPYYDLSEDTQIPGVAPETFSFIFSNKADANINITFNNDQTTLATSGVDGDFNYLRVPVYFEINKESFLDLDLSDKIKEINSDFDAAAAKSFSDLQQVAYTDIMAANTIINNAITNDLAWADASLTQNMANDFSALTIQDYFASFVKVFVTIKDAEYINNLCTSCTVTNEMSDDDVDTQIETNISEIYATFLAEKDSTFSDLHISISTNDRRANQRTANTLYYDVYGDKISPLTDKIENDIPVENLEIHKTYQDEVGGLLGLFSSLLNTPIMQIMPFTSSIEGLIIGLENSGTYQSFMLNTNLDLVLNSFTSNATRSIVIVSTMLITYIIVALSIVLLSLVMVNLFGNVYERATSSRRREFGSLRLLGASFTDIKDVMNKESKITYWFSLALIAALVFSAGYLVSNQIVSPFGELGTSHFYIPSLNLYLDFNMYNVFKVNAIVIFVSLIMFRYYIYKILIKRVALSKISDIDGINSIKFGDDE